MNEQRGQRKKLERLVATSFEHVVCPDADQLAAFLVGDLDESEQRALAAHISRCPRCWYTLDVCRGELPSQSVLARQVPWQPAAGLRSSGRAETSLRYEAGDIDIRLLVSTPDDGYFRVAGQVSRRGSGQAGGVVAMRTPRRRYQQPIDELGFWTFELLPPGHYMLSVSDGMREIRVPDVVLADEDDADG